MHGAVKGPWFTVKVLSEEKDCIIQPPSNSLLINNETQKKKNEN